MAHSMALLGANLIWAMPLIYRLPRLVSPTVALSLAVSSSPQDYLIDLIGPSGHRPIVMENGAFSYARRTLPNAVLAPCWLAVSFLCSKVASDFACQQGW